LSIAIAVVDVVADDLVDRAGVEGATLLARDPLDIQALGDPAVLSRAP